MTSKDHLRKLPAGETASAPVAGTRPQRWYVWVDNEPLKEIVFASLSEARAVCEANPGYVFIGDNAAVERELAIRAAGPEPVPPGGVEPEVFNKDRQLVEEVSKLPFSRRYAIYRNIKKTVICKPAAPEAAAGELRNEVEIGWRGGRVIAGPFLKENAAWTPEQAEQFAGFLLSAAKNARDYLGQSASPIAPAAVSQGILDGIQRIREEWSFGPAQPDYSDYLGTGVTAYQFWLEMRLATVSENKADALIEEMRGALVKALAKGCGCYSSDTEDWHEDNCAIPATRAAVARAEEYRKSKEVLNERN